MPRFLQALDPRRSLTTAVTWLAVGLSLAIALALLTVGDFALNSMLTQRDALMSRFAEQLAAELEHTLAGDLNALQTGHLAAPQAPASPGARLATMQPLDERCLRSASVVALDAQGAAGQPELMLCAPLPDTDGRAARAVATVVSPERLAAIVDRVRERVKPDPRARVLLLDERHGLAFARPAGTPAQELPLTMPGVWLQPLGESGRHVVVTARPQDARILRTVGLQVAVVQPSEESGHEGTLQEKLTAISILLSIIAALIGVVFARRLTRRLADLTVQAQRVESHAASGIAVPRGHDEVALLGRAFGRLLQALHEEREELDRLTHELEQRVQARTREVERLAADSRYAAVVRERLRLARDMHDTLAHSMMEMLVEVRTLRMLHAHDPAKLAAELEHAEEIAHKGLKEARAAVGQMRLNAVRDLGLGAALGSTVTRFAERTGLDVHYSADPQAASFADARAEAVFRIAEEALRNVDRHARATHVDVSLKDAGDGAIELTIADDGVGFDPVAPHPGHYGVTGIREQAQLIDAELELHSAPAAGSVLRLRLRVGPEMSASADDGAGMVMPLG